MRDNNRENFYPSATIQWRALGVILLSLTLLSGCAFFEEPVYNRYGKVIDTEEYAQTTYVEEPLTELEETKSAIAETIQEELPTEVVTLPIATEAEVALESDTAETIVTEGLQEGTEDYSIQLFGAYDKALSQGYIQQHQLESSATVHKLEYQGEPWFVVLSGNYQTYHDATQARKKLAPALTTYGPWVRSLSHKPPAMLPAYSLQLMASRSKEAAKNLISRHNLAPKGYIHETIRTGSPWYLVLYGEYQYVQDARKEIPTLPKSLQELGPWVRLVKEK